MIRWQQRLIHLCIENNVSTRVSLLSKYSAITDALLKYCRARGNKLLPDSLSDPGVMNVTQHKVAFTGCLPITAVVIIPVHGLCRRISAPWTNVLHCLGNNLCSCRCWIDDILIIRLKSKSLEEKASSLKPTETKQQVGCLKKPPVGVDCEVVEYFFCRCTLGFPT